MILCGLGGRDEKIVDGFGSRAAGRGFHRTGPGMGVLADRRVRVALSLLRTPG